MLGRKEGEKRKKKGRRCFGVRIDFLYLFYLATAQG